MIDERVTAYDRKKNLIMACVILFRIKAEDIMMFNHHVEGSPRQVAKSMDKVEFYQIVSCDNISRQDRDLIQADLQDAELYIHAAIVRDVSKFMNV